MRGIPTYLPLVVLYTVSLASISPRDPQDGSTLECMNPYNQPQLTVSSLISLDAKSYDNPFFIEI